MIVLLLYVELCSLSLSLPPQIDPSLPLQIEMGYTDLLNIQENFRDYILYQNKIEKKMSTYKHMKSKEQRVEAKKTLQMLQELLEKEVEPGHVTKFVATSLSARFC